MATAPVQGQYFASLIGEDNAIPTDQTVQWSIINHVDEYGDPDINGTGEAQIDQTGVDNETGQPECWVEAMAPGYIKLVCIANDTGGVFDSKVIEIVVVEDPVLVDTISIFGPNTLGAVDEEPVPNGGD